MPHYTTRQLAHQTRMLEAGKYIDVCDVVDGVETRLGSIIVAETGGYTISTPFARIAGHEATIDQALAALDAA
jgi:hypothetical protein